MSGFDHIGAKSFPVALTTELDENVMVDIDSNGQLVLPSSSNSFRAIGLTLGSSTDEQDDSILVQPLNGSSVEALAGGSFDAGDSLQANASGELIEATTGNHIVAVAEEDGVDGGYPTVTLGAYGKA